LLPQHLLPRKPAAKCDFCGASKSDLQRGMPVPAAGHGRRARSRILRRAAKIPALQNCGAAKLLLRVKTFAAPQKLCCAAKLLLRRKT
jgi:hypothetical protein